jgi:phosphate transport system permease protein
MSDLTRLIARRKRQDMLFNAVGVVCTLVGIVTLLVLLVDLFVDGLGLLRQYRKPLGPAPGANLRIEKKPKGDETEYALAMDVDGQHYRFPVDILDADALENGRPEGQMMLEGDRIIVHLGGYEQITLKLGDEQRRYLTREDGLFTKFRQVSWRFLTSYPDPVASQAGVISPLVGSLLVMLVTIAAAVPLGVAAGVYLEEYGRKNWVTTVIEINISNLAGVPSILYGLMALGLMVYALQLGKSILTAGLTLAFLILPIVIVATRESLRAVPRSIREAAYALGATRWEVTAHHVLPYSTGGILTGMIIGLSRAIGETAPLITIGALSFIAFLPPAPVTSSFPFISFEWLRSPFTVMPIQMFNWTSRPQQEFRVNAAAAGVILIVMALSLNTVAIWLRYRLRRRVKW